MGGHELRKQGVAGRFRRAVVAMRGERGQTLVEVALALPATLLMIFGFIDFSLIIFGMGNANFASRSALRYATMHSSTSYAPTTQQQLNSIVGARIYSFPANTWSVTPYYYSGNVIGSGVYITVTITYHFTVMGHTYNGITYTTTGCGSVQQ
jgi:hypothetical protein